MPSLTLDYKITITNISVSGDKKYIRYKAVISCPCLDNITKTVFGEKVLDLNASIEFSNDYIKELWNSNDSIDNKDLNGSVVIE